MTISRIKIVIILMALAVAAVSFFVVSKKVSSAEFHQAAIESLDEKKNTVMELAAASAGAYSVPSAGSPLYSDAPFPSGNQSDHANDGNIDDAGYMREDPGVLMHRSYGLCRP